MELWIILSVAAAAFQTARFMLQKTLSMGPLTAAGATFARFFYAAPFAMLAACAYVLAQGKGLPELGGFFWIYVLCGGLAQILATLLVVMLFATRNFAVGITLKKTEVIQTALAGFLILGDRVSLAGMLAILIGLVGVLVLSDPPEVGARGWARLRNRAAGLGLASGALFAISAVTYRGATLEVASDDVLLRASLSVAAVTASQSLAMGLWLRWRAPGEVSTVWRARRVAVWLGLASLMGSFCWFTAFTLQNAAYVFAVGQVEVIFSMLAAVLFFREKITGRELWGIGLLTSSILVLVLL